MTLGFVISELIKDKQRLTLSTSFIKFIVYCIQYTATMKNMKGDKCNNLGMK